MSLTYTEPEIPDGTTCKNSRVTDRNRLNGAEAEHSDADRNSETATTDTPVKGEAEQYRQNQNSYYLWVSWRHNIFVVAIAPLAFGEGRIWAVYRLTTWSFILLR